MDCPGQNPANWTCQTCPLINVSFNNSCAACDTPKPTHHVSFDEDENNSPFAAAASRPAADNPRDVASSDDEVDGNVTTTKKEAIPVPVKSEESDNENKTTATLPFRPITKSTKAWYIYNRARSAADKVMRGTKRSQGEELGNCTMDNNALLKFHMEQTIPDQDSTAPPNLLDTEANQTLWRQTLAATTNVFSPDVVMCIHCTNGNPATCVKKPTDESTCKPGNHPNTDCYSCAFAAMAKGVPMIFNPGACACGRPKATVSNRSYTNCNKCVNDRDCANFVICGNKRGEGSNAMVRTKIYCNECIRNNVPGSEKLCTTCLEEGTIGTSLLCHKHFLKQKNELNRKNVRKKAANITELCPRCLQDKTNYFQDGKKTCSRQEGLGKCYELCMHKHEVSGCTDNRCKDPNHGHKLCSQKLTTNGQKKNSSCKTSHRPNTRRVKPNKIWTKNEDNTIIRGFEKFGRKWKDIKEHYTEELKDATEKQISSRGSILLKDANK